MALMEAMASGVPVVATRLSGIPELVRTATRVCWCSRATLRASRRRMARVLEDDALLAARLARRPRAGRASFSLTREAKRLGDLFAESIGRAATRYAPRPVRGRASSAPAGPRGTSHVRSQRSRAPKRYL